MQVLYEDRYILAVHKPAGLSSESGRAAHPSAEKEALDDMLKRTPRRFGTEVPYLKVAHRLDRPASGILLMAKTKGVLSALMTQFEAHDMEKIYLAQTLNPLPESSGELHHWHRRDDSGKKAVVGSDETPGARPVQLIYTLLRQQDAVHTWKIRLQTGRFHQIRAQLAFEGAPIIGDLAYGGEPWQENAIRLHAARLRFRHPKTKEEIVLQTQPDHWNTDLCEYI